MCDDVHNEKRKRKVRSACALWIRTVCTKQPAARTGRLESTVQTETGLPWLPGQPGPTLHYQAPWANSRRGTSSPSPVHERQKLKEIKKGARRRFPPFRWRPGRQPGSPTPRAGPRTTMPVHLCSRKTDPSETSC